MLSFRTLFISLFCAVVAGRAQIPPPAASAVSVAPDEKIERLDAVVVSAGPDPRTAFDLTQGTFVLAGDELHQIVQGTLGETLAGTPGVASTYYGPGASRPVIRGLGGDRIRVLDNGIGALDASNVSPDHNTTLEPLFASRIEVLRGPSTLFYGGSAVGGVVNVIDDTIPETAPDGSVHGDLEVRGGGPARERAAILSAGGGSGRLALHVNALARRTSDLRIRGVPRIDADAPAGQVGGVLPDSASDTETVAAGAGWFGAVGRAGVGITRYETTYGVPTDEAGISIDMRQTRFDATGEVTHPFGIFRSGRIRLSYGDYRHAELSDGNVTNTIFTSRAWEGRIELPHAAIGGLTGTVGVQGSRSDFSAVGEEVATPPSLACSGAIFAVEELKLGDAATLQLGGRVEGESIELGDVDPGLPTLPGYDARSGQTKRFAGLSGSAGVVAYPAKGWALAVAVACTTRLPTAQELFSNGPHGGTGAYEIGTTGLRNESSVGFDLSVRRRAGFVTGSLAVFASRSRNFIFEEELPADAIPAVNNPEGLTPFRFVARAAEFRGAEVEVELHFIDESTRHLHLALTSDYVRAEQTGDRQPLPRIPPLRYGAKLSCDDGRWRAEAGFRHAMKQSRVAPGEPETPGYTLVDASVGYVIPTLRVSYELFLRGSNLGNAAAREHASFLKEFAPLPGRGVVAGVRAAF